MRLALDEAMVFRFYPLSEIQARKSWRRGKGRSRAASRRRSLRRTCSPEEWTRLVKEAFGTAKEPEGHPVAVAKARDFLLTALTGGQAVKFYASSISLPARLSTETLP